MLRSSFAHFLIFGRLLAFCGFLVFGPLLSGAQTVQILTAHPPSSLRGFSAPGGQVLWASGSGGAVGRSVDGGVHWGWLQVPGFEKRDFRDIQAFDSSTVLIMGIDTPAVILRTTDAGVHWTVVFRDDTPGMFLDAMDFSDKQRGTVVGDPIGPISQTRFYMAFTTDSGKTWAPVSLVKRPLADSGEGCFASSGSNVTEARSAGLILHPFVSGGPRSRIFKSGKGETLPLLQGATTTGANSIGIEGDNWIVVGGDFQHDTIGTGNCTYSSDNGAHWLIPHTPPHGYRSCVLHLSGKTWICCGTSGIDITGDGGDHWKLVSRESFHVAAYPGSGKYVFLAGAKGRIAQLDWTLF